MNCQQWDPLRRRSRQSLIRRGSQANETGDHESAGGLPDRSARTGWGSAQEGLEPAFQKPAARVDGGTGQATDAGRLGRGGARLCTGHYTGSLSPSPPHADQNPKKAVVVYWKDHRHRFIFSHEASYCPLLELPSGAAMCNQFFEGNLGDAELFNNLGRKERNSFVDIRESGPQRVWVRWTYMCVHMQDDAQPRLRWHGGLLRLSQRTRVAADELREPDAGQGDRLQHATGRVVRRGAGRVGHR